MRRKGLILLAGLGGLSTLAIATPVIDGLVVTVRPAGAVTGGAGLAGTAGVSWSFFAFDPRLESSCENELWPLAGLNCPNPVHGTGVVDLPAIARTRAD